VTDPDHPAVATDTTAAGSPAPPLPSPIAVNAVAFVGLFAIGLLPFGLSLPIACGIIFRMIRNQDAGTPFVLGIVAALVVAGIVGMAATGGGVPRGVPGAFVVLAAAVYLAACVQANVLLARSRRVNEQ
jgi:hypothetical protein